MSADDRASVDALQRLIRATDRLAEAVQVPAEQPLAIDGTIQRFEVAFELFWKTPKRFLLREGIDARTPRDVLRAAFKARWPEDEAAWLGMLDDRNTTSHIDDETTARRVYAGIVRNLPILKSGVESLKRR